jgi:hypothetical protein
MIPKSMRTTSVQLTIASLALLIPATGALAEDLRAKLIGEAVKRSRIVEHLDDLGVLVKAEKNLLKISLSTTYDEAATRRAVSQDFLQSARTFQARSGSLNLTQDLERSILSFDTDVFRRAVENCKANRSTGCSTPEAFVQIATAVDRQAVSEVAPESIVRESKRKWSYKNGALILESRLRNISVEQSFSAPYIAKTTALGTVAVGSAKCFSEGTSLSDCAARFAKFVLIEEPKKP